MQSASTGPTRTAIATVEIDLEALRFNLAATVAVAKRPALCVVKADGYGHGAVRVVAALRDHHDCAGFVVSRIEEALALRDSGVLAHRSDRPLLCLGSFLSAHAVENLVDVVRTLAQHRIGIVLCSWADVECLTGVLERLDALEAPIEPVHLAVDTGLRREGLEPVDVPGVIKRLSLAQIRVGSVFSHFVEAEQEVGAWNKEQRAQFDGLARELGSQHKRGVRPAMVHLANSAGALSGLDTLPDASSDSVVRIGGALYGVVDLPAEKTPGLKAVMSVRSRLVQTRELQPGVSVGYNHRFTAKRQTLLGLVALGYADGLPSRPAPLGWVPAAQRDEDLPEAIMHRVPVVGTVSMDLATVDLTDAAMESGRPPQPGDEIVALGGPANGRATPIRAAEHAALNQCSPYAITVGFGRRNPTREI